MKSDRERVVAWPRLLPLLLVVLGAAAYANSFSGVFLLDDNRGLVDNPGIRSLRTCLLGTTRPLAALSFCINYKLGGLKVADYHLVNLAIHIMAGLALFGAVRRSLRLPSSRTSTNALPRRWPQRRPPSGWFILCRQRASPTSASVPNL